MAHKYEYAVVVDYFPPVAIGGQLDFSKEQLQVSFLQALQRTAGRLPDAITKTIGEEWEVNSHSITFVNGVAILTLLLQKPR